MVDYAVDHHPLRLDAIFVVLVFQDGVLGILGPPLFTLSHSVLILPSRAIIQTGRLVHVRLPLVVSVHHRVEDLQLEASGKTGGEKEGFLVTFSQKDSLNFEDSLYSPPPLYFFLVYSAKKSVRRTILFLLSFLWM